MERLTRRDCRFRDFIVAENKAYDKLVECGFIPQGLDFKRNQIVVFKRENEHQPDEKTEVYYFNTWQDAVKSLIENTLNN